MLVFQTKLCLEQLIQLYSPDILLVGGDWRRGDVVGREFAKDTRFFNRIGGYSTTKFIDKIIDGDYR